MVLALALVAVAWGQSAEAYVRPDFKLKCRNGEYSKVWLKPLKVVNNCGRHSKQWVEVYAETGDEDVIVWSVQAKTKYTNPDTSLDISGTSARLGRGRFCGNGDLYAIVVFNPDSTWRPSAWSSTTYNPDCDDPATEVIGKRT